MNSTNILLSNFQIEVLNKNSDVFFDCKDDDLNDFFCNQALLNQNIFLSKTYFYKDIKGNIVAMFSICNDNISFAKEQKEQFPENKRYNSYPAVKIARLGTDKSFQSKGIESQIISFLKGFFVVRNKTGCRYLTVDAYNRAETLKFYKKNGFLFLTEKDKNKHTRTMYFLSLCISIHPLL